MGRELAQTYASAREVFEEVDAALSQDLSKIMWEGPKETLTLTENAQPALMAVSMAVMRVLEREKGFSLKDKVKFVAGHSLGRIFRACRGGRLLARRRRAPVEAARAGHAGGGSRWPGCDDGAARRRHRCRAQGGGSGRARRGLPGRQRQRADAGRAFRRRSRRSTAYPQSARQFGVRRAVPLPVSAPFHCALMQPAADAMAKALATVEVRAPVGPCRRQCAGGSRSAIPKRSRSGLSSR